MMGLALSADGTLFASDMLNGAIWTDAGADRFLRRLEVR